MKKIGIIGATLALAVSAYSQGSIVFNNRVVGAVVAPIYGVNATAPTVRLHGNATTNGGSVDYTGVPLLFGSGYSATVWAAAGGTVDQAAFQLLGAATTFRTATTLGGIVQQPVLNLIVPTPLAPEDPNPAKQVAFQMRVWDNKGGTVTDWAAASQRIDVASGFSDIFTIGVAASPPNAPQNLLGLTSFSLTLVPEPGVIAIGALALGALFLRRRKNS
jgi:hypothetical protein